MQKGRAFFGQPRVRGTLSLLAAVAIWGSTFVVTKELLSRAGPFTIAAARFLIALAVLMPFARRRGYRLAMSFAPRFLLFGLTGVTLYFGLQNLGLALSTAANAALITGSIPAVTLVLSLLILRERLLLRQVAGVAVSVLGVGLVVQGGAGLGDPGRLLGNLLLFGSALSWGLYTVQGKQMGAEYHPLVATAGSIAAGLLILLPAAVAELAFRGPPDMTIGEVGGMLYLGMAASALTLFLWNFALQSVPPVVAAPFVNLIPVVGLALALVLGERVTALQLAGGAIVAAGVVLSRAPASGRSRPGSPSSGQPGGGHLPGEPGPGSGSP
jgi:drug/metabolite transporter (DMT)-like permease